jgi:hypothetical protein
LLTGYWIQRLRMHPRMRTGYWIQRLRMHPRMRHQATTNTLAPSTCNHWWKEWDGGMGAGEPMAHFSEGRSGLMGEKHRLLLLHPCRVVLTLPSHHSFLHATQHPSSTLPRCPSASLLQGPYSPEPLPRQQILCLSSLPLLSSHHFLLMDSRVAKGT